MSSVIVVAFIVLAASIAAFCFIALSRRAARTDDDSEPAPPFECGTPPKEAYPRRVAVSYFLTAILFVVGLTALVLLIIWARDFTNTTGDLRTSALIGGGILALLTAVGFGYAWRVGAFNWEK
jgi:NADH-quinone oxidoreductase subunit A